MEGWGFIFRYYLGGGVAIEGQGGVRPPGIVGGVRPRGEGGGAGSGRRGSWGGGGKLTFSKVQHLALLYNVRLGTDLDLPLYGSPLNPITISFHDYTIIFSLSNGIKALEPPKRSFFLIHSQPKNLFFRTRTYFFTKKFVFSQRNALLKNKKKNASRPCG